MTSEKRNNFRAKKLDINLALRSKLNLLLVLIHDGDWEQLSVKSYHFVLVLSIYAGFFKMHPVALDNFYLLFFYLGGGGDIFKIKTIQNKGLDCKGEE